MEELKCIECTGLAVWVLKNCCWMEKRYSNIVPICLECHKKHLKICSTESLDLVDTIKDLVVKSNAMYLRYIPLVALFDKYSWLISTIKYFIESSERNLDEMKTAWNEQNLNFFYDNPNLRAEIEDTIERSSELYESKIKLESSFLNNSNFVSKYEHERLMEEQQRRFDATLSLKIAEVLTKYDNLLAGKDQKISDLTLKLKEAKEKSSCYELKIKEFKPLVEVVDPIYNTQHFMTASAAFLESWIHKSNSPALSKLDIYDETYFCSNLISIESEMQNGNDQNLLQKFKTKVNDTERFGIIVTQTMGIEMEYDGHNCLDFDLSIEKHANALQQLSNIKIPNMISYSIFGFSPSNEKTEMPEQLFFPNEVETFSFNLNVKYQNENIMIDGEDYLLLFLQKFSRIKGN